MFLFISATQLAEIGGRDSAPESAPQLIAEEEGVEGVGTYRQGALDPP